MTIANDVVSVLRGRDALTVHDIVAATGHSLETVRRVLAQMTDRGLVFETITPAYKLVAALDVPEAPAASKRSEGVRRAWERKKAAAQ